MINSKTSLLGLIGYPVGHSFSPTLHNAVMNQVNFNGAYMAFPVEKDKLEKAIQGLKAVNFFGCNVTVPHKSNCMAQLDIISDTAKNIGAVNTIIHRDGKLYGDNTDAYGFSKMLHTLTSIDTIKRAGILGAGGSAKSVLVSLASMGINEIVVFARNMDKCKAFISNFSQTYPSVTFEPVPLSDFKDQEDTLDLLVNCTPVGMHPNVEFSPVQLENPKSTLIIVDLVYNPKLTTLMKLGQEKDLTVSNGIDMLIYQAAKSFELWTGTECEDLYLQAAKEIL